MNRENQEKPGLSDNLREARERKGMSVMGLSKLSGVSRQTVIDAENGSRTPRLDSLKRLANVLETTPEALIAGEEPRPSGLRGAYNKAQREPMRPSLIRQAMLKRAHEAAVKAWMDFYETCLKPSVRESVMDRLMNRAGHEEFGRRDVLKVFEEMLDDSDDRLREYELATQQWEINSPPNPILYLDEQEPTVPGGNK